MMVSSLVLLLNYGKCSFLFGQRYSHLIRFFSFHSVSRCPMSFSLPFLLVSLVKSILSRRMGSCTSSTFSRLPKVRLSFLDKDMNVTHICLYTVPSDQRMMGAFVLSVILNTCKQAQNACISTNLITACIAHIRDPDAMLRRWVVLCLAKFWEDFDDVSESFFS